jgi:CBS domain containing-hemolysin-like protein
VRRSRIEVLALDGDRHALLLLELIDNLNAYLSATQLGITVESMDRQRIRRVCFTPASNTTSNNMT